MTAAVVLCLLLTGVFAVTAPAAGRRLPPAAAVRVLVVGSVLAAGAGAFALAAAAFVEVAQWGAVARWGEWSPAALRAGSELPPVVNVGCGVLVVLAAGWALVVVVRRARALWAVRRSCAGLDSADRVTVLDNTTPDAFTTPDILGRIVITTGLLRALTEPQQRAVLAHEHSHLIHRHSWWLLLADLAAGVNPLLRPTATAIAHAIERWADEDAATAVADRRLVATAVAAAALARRHSSPGSSPAMAATGGHVPQRVRALLSAPPRRRPLLLAGVVALLVCTVGATIAVERSGDELFDHAGISVLDVR
jgi:Zn-dependent protease with chaperone function